MTRLLTLTQARRRLGVSESALRKMIRAGEFPEPIRRNARWLRIPETDVTAYLQRMLAQRQTPAPE